MKVKRAENARGSGPFGGVLGTARVRRAGPARHLSRTARRRGGDGRQPKR